MGSPGLAVVLLNPTTPAPKPAAPGPSQDVVSNTLDTFGQGSGTLAVLPLGRFPPGRPVREVSRRHYACRSASPATCSALRSRSMSQHSSRPRCT